MPRKIFTFHVYGVYKQGIPRWIPGNIKVELCVKLSRIVLPEQYPAKRSFKGRNNKKRRGGGEARLFLRFRYCVTVKRFFEWWFFSIRSFILWRLYWCVQANLVDRGWRVLDNFITSRRPENFINCKVVDNLVTRSIVLKISWTIKSLFVKCKMSIIDCAATRSCSTVKNSISFPEFSTTDPNITWIILVINLKFYCLNTCVRLLK